MKPEDMDFVGGVAEVIAATWVIVSLDFMVLKSLYREDEAPPKSKIAALSRMLVRFSSIP